MVESAVQLTKSRGEWVGAVPEASAVGESQSNGRAERAVQRVEDLVRTFLGELEDRLGCQLKSNAPVLSWLVEYVAVVLNKYHLNDSTGMTAYKALHGADASERLAFFAERVFFLIPKRRRSNLDLRWGSGVFLGTLMSSNEALIALPDGDITRARSIARLVPNQRWNTEAILAIKGVPGRPRPRNPADDVRGLRSRLTLGNMVLVLPVTIDMPSKRFLHVSLWTGPSTAQALHPGVPPYFCT